MKFTRTVKIYTYYTGRFDPVAMTMSELQSHTFPEELGSRAKAKLAKEYGSIVSETTTDALFEIDAMDFIQLSHLIAVNGEKVDPADRSAECKRLGVKTLDRYDDILDSVNAGETDGDSEV